ncbi:hypothetical protein AAC387_Pa05g1230 [Persea americana]
MDTWCRCRQSKRRGTSSPLIEHVMKCSILVPSHLSSQSQASDEDGGEDPKVEVGEAKGKVAVLVGSASGHTP